MCSPRTTRTTPTTRAVSPVIGVVLLTAVTVVVAAVVGALAMGFESQLGAPEHPVAFDTEWVADGDGNSGNGAYVVVAFTGGEAIAQERVLVVDHTGTRITWDDVWTTDPKPVVEPGDEVHLDGVGSDGALQQICDVGDTYRIVVRGPNGGTTVVDKFVAPSPPTVTTDGC
jgi:flagellin-like protein